MLHFLRELDRLIGALVSCIDEPLCQDDSWQGVEEKHLMVKMSLVYVKATRSRREQIC